MLTSLVSETIDTRLYKYSTYQTINIRITWFNGYMYIADKACVWDQNIYSDHDKRIYDMLLTNCDTAIIHPIKIYSQTLFTWLTDRSDNLGGEIIYGNQIIFKPGQIDRYRYRVDGCQALEDGYGYPTTKRSIVFTASQKCIKVFDEGTHTRYQRIKYMYFLTLLKNLSEVDTFFSLIPQDLIALLEVILYNSS